MQFLTQPPARGCCIRKRSRATFYPCDLYRLDDQLLTAGYYGEALLLACAFGYTSPTAWEAAIAVASSVRLAGRAYRLDGAGADYPSSPLRRYEAPTAMGYPQAHSAAPALGDDCVPGHL